MGNVIIVDKGWDAMKHSLSSMKDAYTKVGFPMESPKTTAQEGGGRLTVGEVAGVLENGSEKRNIPPRPFLMPAFDNNLEANKKLCGTLGTAVLNGKMETETALSLIGEKNRDYIVQAINNVWTPPLARRTLAARRRAGNSSTKPLVFTAQMKSSVTHVEVLK